MVKFDCTNQKFGLILSNMRENQNKLVMLANPPGNTKKLWLVMLDLAMNFGFRH